MQAKGVRYCRNVNFLTALFYSAVSLIYFGCAAMVLVGYPIFFAAQMTIEARIVGFCLLGLGVFAMVLALAFVKMNDSVKDIDPNAHSWSIAFYFTQIWAFPIGTVLHGLGLYFLLMTNENDEAVTEKNPRPSAVMSVVRGLLLSVFVMGIWIAGSVTAYQFYVKWQHKLEEIQAVEEERLAKQRQADAVENKLSSEYTYDKATGNVYF